MLCRIHSLALLYFLFLLREAQVVHSDNSTGANGNRTKAFNENWIAVSVDYTGSTNKKWQMKYYESLEFWERDGPIYAIFGDTTIISNPDSYHIIYDIVNETRGKIVVSEHRYYGGALPVDFQGVSSLKFLSIFQVLGDMATLMEHLKKDSHTKHSKVVMVGCGYSGNLAVWFRAHFPNVADMAITFGAPLLAKVDFFEFYETLIQNYENYGPTNCTNNIQRHFGALELAMAKRMPKLKKEFNVCPDCDLSNDGNKCLFYNMRLRPYVKSIFNDVSYFEKHCEKIAERKYGELKYWPKDKGRRYYDKEANCEVIDYEYDLKYSLQHTQDRAWMYQSCNEYGHAITTSGANQPFGNHTPVSFFYSSCRKLFGDKYTQEFIDGAIKSTNDMFGGLTPTVTRVLFLQGELDPYHTLGVTPGNDTETPALLIPKMPQGKIFSKTSADDPTEWAEARSFIKATIKEWLR